MWMRGNEIIDLPNAVALEGIEHNLALACVSSVNEHCFSRRRDNQNRIAFDRTNIKNVYLEFTTRRWLRLQSPLRQPNLPPGNSCCADDDRQNCNRASTASCRPTHY